VADDGVVRSRRGEEEIMWASDRDETQCRWRGSNIVLLRREYEYYEDEDEDEEE
jgi:hypothetical protein